MSNIEKALLGATKVKPQKDGEDRQKFLIRTMVGVQKLPGEEWEALAAVDGAQDWYNAATDADNAEKPVPDFPDVEAAEEEPDDDAGETAEDADGGAPDDSSEEEQVKPKVKKTKGAKVKVPPKKDAAPAKAKAGGAKKTAEKPAEKKAVKADGKKAAPAKKGTSMRRALKRMVIKKPSRTVEELMEALEKQGYKSPSRLTVATMRADTRDTIKVLNEAGLTNIQITDGRSAA